MWDKNCFEQYNNKMRLCTETDKQLANNFFKKFTDCSSRYNIHIEGSVYSQEMNKIFQGVDYETSSYRYFRKPC